MEKEIQTIRVVPFVKEAIKEKKGKKYISYNDNLTSTELKKMSCEPKIFELIADGIYDLYDTPLTFKGSGLRLRLCYLYDELNEEEKEKFFERSETISIIIKDNKKEETKTTPKKRVKERK